MRKNAVGRAVLDQCADNVRGVPMGLDDIVNKGKDLFEENKDKVTDALKSERAEDVSDKVLDGVSGFAKKVLPDSVDEKIDDVRDNIDKSIGNE